MTNLNINLHRDMMPTERSCLEILKRISKLALPMAASYTLSIEISALGFFLNHLHADEEHAASVTLITSMINSLDIIAISPLFAMSIIVGKHWGSLQISIPEGDEEASQEVRDKIARVYHNGLAISLIMLPILSLPMVFSDTIFKNIFKQNPTVSFISQEFLRIYAFASPALLLRLCSEQIMFSFRKTKPAMIIGLSSAFVGLSLAVILGFGKLGAPKLGVLGVLIGYILEAYLTAISYTLYIALHSTFKGYHFFKPRNPSLQFTEMKELLTLGGPIFLGNTIEMGSFLGIGFVSGLCGVIEQATFSLALQITLLSFLLQAAFGQTCSQEMSRLIGAGDSKLASSVGKYGIVTTLLYVMPAPLLFAIQPRLLLILLGQDKEENYMIARTLFPIMGSAIFLEALRYQWLQQLRNNLNDAKFATIYSSCCMLFSVSLAYIFGTKTSLGVYGVGMGYALGLLTAAIPLGIRWARRINFNEDSTRPIAASSPASISFFSNIRRTVSQPAENSAGYSHIS
jgi:MATE family multidrug resistance protein